MVSLTCSGVKSFKKNKALQKKIKDLFNYLKE